MVDLYFSKQCCSCGKLNTQKGEQNWNQIWNQLQSIPTQNPEISNQITSQSFFFLSFRRKRERERERRAAKTYHRQGSIKVRWERIWSAPFAHAMKKTERVRIMGLSVRENIGFKLKSMDRPKRFDLFSGSKWTQDLTTVLILLNPGFTFIPRPGRRLNTRYLVIYSFLNNATLIKFDGRTNDATQQPIEWPPATNNWVQWPKCNYGYNWRTIAAKNPFFMRF